MGCRNKIKHTCGTRLNSRCVTYEEYIPEDSELFEEDCITIEETTKDLYTITDTIKDDIDLEFLGNNCIDYEEEIAGDIKVKEALQKLEEEICTLKDSIIESDGECCIDVNTIKTECLVDECGTGFSTPNELIQAIIDKLCEIATIVETNHPTVEK